MTRRNPFQVRPGEKRRDTAGSLEIDRIINLPVVYGATEEEVEAFSREEVEASYFEEGFRLLPTQVGAVLAWDLFKGVFGPIGVGWGKTAITLMIANRAFTEGDSDRTILFVPSQVYDQLVRNDIAWVRKRVGLKVPFIYMAGKSLAERKSIATSGKKGCYIMTYSLLSTRDSDDLLDWIKPQLIIADEAHEVRNLTAARSARLMRYMSEQQPYLVALSGTITKKSINDYHHLIAYALRKYCPLPLDAALSCNWSFVLDADADPSDAQTGPIYPLLDWARRNFPDAEGLTNDVMGFREAYQLRLTHTPGVVATGDAQIGTSLVLQNSPVKKYTQHKDWPRLKELIDQVEELWISPSGDEIELGFHKWRYLYELSFGFYYNLRWPTLEELGKRGYSEEAAQEALDGALAHHEAHQEYSKELRQWLKYRSKPKLDTPFLVGGEMARNGAANVGAGLYELWSAMKAMQFEDMPERISEPIRICSYKVDHVLQWAQSLKKGEGALIWFHHQEAGRWIAEVLQKAGLPVIYCPSESHRKGSNAAIRDERNANKIVVASMRGHGTGKNLQHFQRQLYPQFPRDASLIEQVLGRTHRTGQTADVLIAETMNTIEFDHTNMSACLVDALYTHQTMGAPHKLIYSSYNPMPKIFPDNFLRERGFTDISKLDRKAQELLEEKFGSK